jgi:hypothetical protein
MHCDWLVKSEEVCVVVLWHVEFGEDGEVMILLN